MDSPPKHTDTDTLKTRDGQKEHRHLQSDLENTLDGYSHVMFAFFERKYYSNMRKNIALLDKKQANKN